MAAGGVTIGTPQNGTLNINQNTNQGIINWNAYSIGVGGTVNYNQPGASSATLNRVTSSTPSWIAGTINAPGTVLLVNPNGIAITKSGVINTGSFSASTLGITNADFLAGRYQFQGNGASAPVSNAGRINVSDGGFVALLGGRVSNSGVISAKLGKVGLGSGERATIDLSGDGFLSVTVPSNQTGGRALVSNRGTINANGGLVNLSAATAANALRNAVNMPGTIRANSVGVQNGKIVLNGGPGGIVNVGGRLVANGGKRGNGGSIAVAGAKINIPGQITANGKSGGQIAVVSTGDLAVSGKVSAKGSTAEGGRIDLAGTDIRLTGALIDASGVTGGGLVRIGGTFQGGNGDPTNPLYQSFIGRFGNLPAIPTATTVSIDATTKINVSALKTGDGGTAIIWSNEHTAFAGTILGTGGPLGGNGGFVEVSGEQSLSFNGTVNTLAPLGATGMLLLDPNVNVHIISGLSTDGFACAGGTCAAANTSTSAIDANFSVTTLTGLLATTSVNVVTTVAGGTGAGNISVETPISWTTTSGLVGTSLTLTAAGTITFSNSLDTITATNSTAGGAGGAIHLTATGPSRSARLSRPSGRPGRLPIPATAGGAGGAISISGSSVTINAAISSTGGNGGNANGGNRSGAAGGKGGPSASPAIAAPSPSARLSRPREGLGGPNPAVGRPGPLARMGT